MRQYAVRLGTVRFKLSFLLCCSVEGNLGSLADESVLENSALATPLTRQRRYGHDFSGESCHFPGHHGHRGHHGHHPHGPPRFGFGWHEPPPHPPPFGFDPLADNPSPDQQVPQYKAPLAPFNGGCEISKATLFTIILSTFRW